MLLGDLRKHIKGALQHRRNAPIDSFDKSYELHNIKEMHLDTNDEESYLKDAEDEREWNESKEDRSVETLLQTERPMSKSVIGLPDSLERSEICNDRSSLVPKQIS